MNIADNVARLQDRIEDCCAKSNRHPGEITLVAVSKQKSVDEILEAAAAGIQHFGENRVEEGVRKIPNVKERSATALTWHMVGHIQSRKAKQVVPVFDVIHSVDSVRLAERLSRLAESRGRDIPVLLEINVSGEASKFGLEGYNWCRDSGVKDKLWQEVIEILALPNISVSGLMTMAPFRAPADVIRATFADLFGLRQELSATLNQDLPELSMGMTDDYPIAIEEGATMIRIGRAIFGARQA